MKPFPRLAMTAAALLLLAGTSQAQFVGGFGQRQVGVGLHIRSGPFNSFSFASRSYAFGPIYGPVPSWHYGWPGVPVVPNPIIIQPNPPIVIQNIIQAGGQGRQPFVPPEMDAPAAPNPAAKAAKPPVPPRPRVPERLEVEEAPRPAGRRVDADRITEAGRKAFTDGQHGRALELFRRAVEIAPNDPSAQYLVSQVQFALGKYREAVAAIGAGMALRADWPEARFVSRDLFWKKPEQFEDHLKALREAVAAFPNDAELAFLLGHQLWFDGKPDEARPLFQKAVALAKGRTPAEAFLTR